MAESSNTTMVNANQNHGSRSRKTSNLVRSKCFRTGIVSLCWLGVVFNSGFSIGQ